MYALNCYDLSGMLFITLFKSPHIYQRIVERSKKTEEVIFLEEEKGLTF